MSYTMLVDPVRFSMTQLDRTTSTLKTVYSRPTSLLSLPDEILLMIVHYLDFKRDFLNLSLTCRKLEDVAVQRLYEKVDIQIPVSRSRTVDYRNRVPAFRPHIFKSMQDLTIRSGAVDLTDPIAFRNRTTECSVDDYVCDILQRVPPDQLKSFSLLYQTSLTSKMVEMLAIQQAHCLEDLRFFGADFDGSGNVSLPRKLRRIHCRSMQSGEVLTKLIEVNQETLEHLHIGQEKELAENYRRNRVGFLEHLTAPSGSLELISNFGLLRKLRKLWLVGLDLEPFSPPDIQSASFLWKLEALAVESCSGSTQFLDAVSSTFQQLQSSQFAESVKVTPALKSFTFRHEALSGHMKEALIHLLSSFAGLTKLALLFENATLIERPSIFIANHGSTLESLVIETRIQPRENLGLDTSRPLGIGRYSHQLWQESINDVCELCPNLTELGMGFPWDDEMVRLKKTKLASLRDLRTIHIRNFPQSQVLSQIGDYAIQEYARRFVEWSFPSLVGSDRPGLETLAIGPTLYESRWKCSSVSGSHAQSSSNFRRFFSPPEYLRSHYFCLDWAKTRFGRWNAMITPVTEKYMEELRDERPLEGIFEHVWLR